ncbi:MAG: xanthine dehydrogenase family protein subunit M [Candidatus Thiodiazotropha endolucinida]
MSTRILTEFELLTPKTIPEALDILDEYRDSVTPIAGGTDVLVAMKFGFSTEYAMSISAIPELDYLSFDPDKGLRIGANTTIAQILDSKAVKQHYSALWQSAKIFATPQIRNSATLLGNLLRASPAGDCSCAIYALGGSIVLASKQGEREVDIDDLWISYQKTERRIDELAIELRVPAPRTGSTSAFKRLTRVNEDLAKLNVAVNLVMDTDRCTDARIAMGCVAPTPIRLRETEKKLIGQELDGTALKRITASVKDEINPIDDQRSTAEYRKSVSGVFLRRAIEQACSLS